MVEASLAEIRGDEVTEGTEETGSARRHEGNEDDTEQSGRDVGHLADVMNGE